MSAHPFAAEARRADLTLVDFTPAGLRAHAEQMDVISAALAIEAGCYVGEDRLTLEDCATDALRAATILRAFADGATVTPE